ncbi:hypothetical protein ACUR5C_12965 [Aliikangiella sp. IMCC44653]
MPHLKRVILLSIAMILFSISLGLSANINRLVSVCTIETGKYAKTAVLNGDKILFKDEGGGLRKNWELKVTSKRELEFFTLLNAEFKYRMVMSNDYLTRRMTLFIIGSKRLKIQSVSYADFDEKGSIWAADFHLCIN